jgi:hypothetical protein
MNGFASSARSLDKDGEVLQMTLPEHLEELRERLIRILAGAAISFVACLIFAEQLWRIVQAPLLETVTKLHGKIIATGPTGRFSIIYVWTPLVASCLFPRRGHVPGVGTHRARLIQARAPLGRALHFRGSGVILSRRSLRLLCRIPLRARVSSLDRPARRCDTVHLARAVFHCFRERHVRGSAHVRSAHSDCLSGR